MPARTPGQLNTLLRIRRRQEDMKAQAVAETRRKTDFAREQQRALAEAQNSALEQAGELARKEFDAGDVRRYYQYERHLARLSVEKDAEIRGLESEAETRRRALEGAMKRRRIIERLQEHRLASFLVEQRKDEQKLTDEVANNYAVMARRSAAASARERNDAGERR